MSASVRIFYFAELIRAPVIGADLAQDSVQLLRLPPLGKEMLTCDTSLAGNSAAAPEATRIASLQVQPGKKVHVRATPAGNTLVEAVNSDMIIEGNVQINCGPGWLLSFKEYNFD